MPQPIPSARIRRLSLVMAGACLLGLIALPLFICIYWAISAVGDLAGAGSIASTAILAPLRTWQRVACASVTLLSAIPMMLALSHARRCFLLLAAGDYFAATTIGHLRGFAACTFTACFTGFAATPAISVLLTLNNPPGTRLLSLGLSSHDFSGAFVAGMVWVIAAVMSHATALAEENAQFI